MKFVTIILLLAACTIDAEAQQYRNLDIQPDASGGYSGTYGRQNFEAPPDGRRNDPRGSTRRFPPTSPGFIVPDEGVTGKTQRRCYATGNGNTICR